MCPEDGRLGLLATGTAVQAFVSALPCPLALPCHLLHVYSVNKDLTA